ncbi:hypothetical protein TRFO_29386 [Tritrichomonas foetus]|uniref:Uncharacterized protein n=1 Tax=Tritrichomonas foetus TaxID=1144522 RepID=A0A1J4K0F3_9EUKA|nr:hypothetical protein TRFO_29386 [Tritrichomonas foetus]|eukprot:OHT03252.1 hypothetical protein TRFO_29386 [Tritrichomonas foetus]
MNEEEISQIEAIFSAFLSNNNIVRRQAENAISRMISESPTFAISLLNCSHDKNYAFQKLALIVIKNIIKSHPEFIFENFQQFDVSFQNYLRSTSDFYIQQFICHLMNIIDDYHQIKWPFSENSFKLYQESLVFLPFSLLSIVSKVNRPGSKQYVQFLLEDALQIIQLVLTNPNDFQMTSISINLLILLLKMKVIDFNSDYLGNCMKMIFNISQQTTGLDAHDFTSYWTILKRFPYNIPNFENFFLLAFNFLEMTTEFEYTRILLFFITKFSMYIKREQIPFLIHMILFVQLNDSCDNDVLPLLEKFKTIGDFDLFGYCYSLFSQIFQNPQSFVIPNKQILNKQVEIQSVSLMFLSEIIDCCKNKIPISIVKQIVLFCDTFSQNVGLHEEMLQGIFVVINIILQSFSYLDFLDVIIEIIFRLITPNSPTFLLCNCLLQLETISQRENSYLKLYLLDRLLNSDLKNVNNNNTLIYIHYLNAILGVIPEGRLFPETKYSVLREIMMTAFQSASYEVKLIGACLGIKLYFIDQSYQDIIPTSLNIILFSYRLRLDVSLVNSAFDILKNYLKLFKDECLSLMRSINYYKDFISYVGNLQYTQYSMLIEFVGYIFKYDSGNIDASDKIKFTQIIFREGFYRHNIDYINCFKKFVYLAKTSKIFPKIFRDYFIYLKWAFEEFKFDEIENLTKFIRSIFNPSHISLNKDIPDYPQIAQTFLNEYVRFITQYLSKNSQYMMAFFPSFIQAVQVLTCYDLPIIHSFLKDSLNFCIEKEKLCNNEIDATENMNLFIDLLSFFNQMVDNKIATNEEIEQILNVYQLILCKCENMETSRAEQFVSVYISMSHVSIHYGGNILQPFYDTLENNFRKLEDDDRYIRPILSTLLLMLFKFFPENVYPNLEVVNNIFANIELTVSNGQQLLDSSLFFLMRYQDSLPPNIILACIRIYIIYISHLRFAKQIFQVKDETHNQIVEVVRNYLLSYGNELFVSCFEGAPNAMQQALDILGLNK